MRRGVTTVFIVGLVTAAVGLGAGLAPAQAGPPDLASPAGPVTGAIVVFPPGFGLAPVVLPGPLIVAPKSNLITPIPPAFSAGTSGPALPGILLLTPMSPTGSVVVPVRVSSAGGMGGSLTQLLLVIPGPNPAQNTPISLAQLLTTLLVSLQPAGHAGAPAGATPGLPLVTVFTTSSR